jgi:hypothetical protein
MRHAIYCNEENNMANLNATRKSNPKNLSAQIAVESAEQIAMSAARRMARLKARLAGQVSK